jgi:hypothetical protein
MRTLLARSIAATAIALFLKISITLQAQAAPPPLWVRTLEGPNWSFAGGVVADASGNVYVNGSTGSTFGQSSLGNDDAFLVKYNAAGDKIWTRQHGSSAGDGFSALALDPTGNIFTVGITDGSMDGPQLGGGDCIARKYDDAGNLLWGRQFGTANWDVAQGAAADSSGNFFVTGFANYTLAINPRPTYAYLRKLNMSGNLLWELKIDGTGDDLGSGVGVDALGNSYVCGSTDGALQGPNAGASDVFLSKVDPSGVVLWTRQFGDFNEDIAYNVAVDPAGDSYVTGRAFNAMFLKKYDSDGHLQWTQQGGDNSRAGSVSLDGLGNVYIAGQVQTTPFVAKFSTAGALAWWRYPPELASGYLPAVDPDGLPTCSTLRTPHRRRHHARQARRHAH